MPNVAMGTLRSSRTDARERAERLLSEQLKSPLVQNAADAALSAISREMSAKFTGRAFASGAPTEIGHCFLVDPSTGKAWQPAVAEAVKVAMLAQTGDDKGYAEVRHYYQPAKHDIGGRDEELSICYLVIAESAEVAQKIPDATRQAIVGAYYGRGHGV